MKMEWLIVGVIWLVTLFGSFFGGWFARPPEAQITQIDNKMTTEVVSETKVITTTVMSTEVYNFPEKVWGTSITNTNEIKSFLKTISSNTNYFISTTNTRRSNI